MPLLANPSGRSRTRGGSREALLGQHVRERNPRQAASRASEKLAAARNFPMMTKFVQHRISP